MTNTERLEPIAEHTTNRGREPKTPTLARTGMGVTWWFATMLALGQFTTGAAYAQSNEPCLPGYKVYGSFCIMGEPSDRVVCETKYEASTILRCTRAIQSGQYLGEKLVSLHIRRADIYFREQQFDRAIADFTSAIRLNKEIELSSPVPWTSTEPLTKRADAYEKKREWDRAIADYNEAIRLSRHPSHIERRGDMYRQKGDYQRAIADYSEVIEREGPDRGGSAYLGRAAAYRQLNDRKRAIEDYRTIESALFTNHRDEAVRRLRELGEKPH